MIELEKIIYSNIQAVGKHPIMIDFKKHPRTLIIGKNGSGKSTLINALCFVLFGVPYSDINKPTLLNSINKKELKVELDFKVGTNQYKIIRGIKPNIFEVYKDGEKLPQEAKSLDYQKQIEEGILKLNFNAFKQIVVIGKGGFTPFMRLKAAERREIIENILDLKIFSTMNSLLKERNDNLKEKISDNQKSIDKVDTEIHYSKKQLDFIRDAMQKSKEKSEKKNEEIQLEITKAQKKIEAVIEVQAKLIESLNESAKVKKVKSNIQEQKFQIGSELQLLEKQQRFFAKNEICPTCTQPIDSSFKDGIVNKNNEHIHTYQEKQKALDDKLVKVDDLLEKIAAKQAQIDQLTNAKTGLNMKVRQLQESLIEEVEEELQDATEITNQIISLAKDKTSFETIKDELYKTKEMQTTASALLKDTGIKSKIIATYIPLINKFLNEYLDLMNFFVQFEIDENFKEVIRSRYRDEFSYENFSEGEKNRIDLALLFAWRDIAKTKNRINVNLLILDEVFDSSLDVEGLDDLNKILKALGDQTNVFVISHKAEVMENFPRVIEFSKRKMFTTMSVVS